MFYFLSHSKFQERRDSLFFTENGKTFYDDKQHLFGDFTLKIVGEITSRISEVEGQYVMTCGELKRGRHVAR